MRTRILTFLTVATLLISFSPVTSADHTGNPCATGPCWKTQIPNARGSVIEKDLFLKPGAAKIEFTGGDKVSALVTVKLMRPGNDPATDAYDYVMKYLVIDGKVTVLSAEYPEGPLKSGHGWRVEVSSQAFSSSPPTANPLTVNIHAVSSPPVVKGAIDGPAAGLLP